MKQLFSQRIQPKMQDMKKHPVLQFGKILFLGCFFAGFVIFLILGKEFLDDISLLSVNSLREIKDCSLDNAAYFQYIFWRRLWTLLAGILLWWWGFGKWFVYGVLGCTGLSMGICMYTCLMRYHMKGIFLWFFLYFPHALFYAAVLICGMILSAEVFREKAEKIKFLWQNILWVLLMLAMFFLGMYTESFINAALLQDYLQFF